MVDAVSHTQDFLIRGFDYLERSEAQKGEEAQNEGFKLVGRDDVLEKVIKTLTRQQANSILLVGPGGVGCSSICKGLEVKKDDPDASYDIVGKRLFWLDTDGLFASGNSAEITESFQKALGTLSRYQDTVLIIDDMKDFVDGARDNGCTNIINALMRAIRQDRFQTILESDDDDIQAVLGCHSDMMESFTLIDVQQPDPESLKLIVDETSKGLEAHHKIKISDEAKAEAIKLTNKYRVRDIGLSRAQPSRTLALLDRALTSYRLEAHSKSPELEALKTRLAETDAALESGNLPANQTKESLEALKTSLESDIAEQQEAWDARQGKVKKIYKNLRSAEERIRMLEDRLDLQLKKEEEARLAAMDDRADKGEEALQLKSGKLQEFEGLIGDSTFESAEVSKIRSDIKQAEGFVTQYKAEFKTLTADINAGLELTKEHVLAEFSEISGVPVSKLTQNQKEKLLNLERNLGNRVWGQGHAVKKLAGAIKKAKAGLKDPKKPQAAFLYLGPSGVGKTELAKALAEQLFDDENAILRFDMSEYMEKHAVAKLIGAPPGYEGYEAGGILTNEIRKNPNRIVLFDEIEKADRAIFDVFLQMLDEGRLTDNRGLTVSFSETVILMTSNIGAKHFLVEDDFDVAMEKAKKDLDEENGLRPEFLNRFNGRRNIMWFNRLSLPVIEKIAVREMSKMVRNIQSTRPDLDLHISETALENMCRDHYDPAYGARGITGYIDSEIGDAVVDAVLEEDHGGTMEIRYDVERRKILVDPPRDLSAPANDLDSPSPVDEARKSFGGQQPS